MSSMRFHIFLRLTSSIYPSLHLVTTLSKAIGELGRITKTLYLLNYVDEWGVLMLEWERILKQDCLLRAMTGLNCKGFEALLPSFAIALISQQLYYTPGFHIKYGLGGRIRSCHCAKLQLAKLCF